MLNPKHAFSVGKKWISPSRSTKPIYSDWSHTNTLEMQALAVRPSNSNLSVEIGTPTTQHDDHKTPSPSSSQVPFFNHAPKSKARRVFKKLTTGWRFGVLDIAIWASVVFLINLIVTIWGSTQGSKNGVLFEGDCKRVKTLNTGIHVLINVLSTILLGGSNYCMQCLSAPTRSEVDKAHAKGTWLDIGMPSIRNVPHISWRRLLLWSLLALSSLPLHLFYNSAVFASLSSNSYFAFSVSKSFIEDTECTNCRNVNASAAYLHRYVSGGDRLYSSTSVFHSTDIPDILEDLHSAGRAGTLEKLSPAECINQYSTLIPSDRRHVLLVASEEYSIHANNSLIPGSHVNWATPFYADSAENSDAVVDAYNWICSSIQTSACSTMIDVIKANSGSWRVGWNCTNSRYDDNCVQGVWPVEYCLSQKVKSHCRLQFNTTIAILVTVLNFVKAGLMFYVAVYITEEPLITMGDAVASFLSKHDPSTKNMCLLSRNDFKKKGYKAGPKEWRNDKHRWKDVTSKKRRFSTIVVFLGALATLGFLLYLGIYHLPTDFPRNFRSLATLGYGTVDPRTAITGISNDVLTLVLIANSPQVILSVLYVSYNALFTAMLLGQEWTSYASKRKGLRVSTVSNGEQRSSYFLQLPYRVGIPLMILSGTLHWLVSQSIFLLAIDYYDFLGRAGNNVYSPVYNEYMGMKEGFKTCGYSPIAIISVMIITVLMIAALVAIGFVPYEQGMTLAGSCSMAISAACHVETEEDWRGENGTLTSMGKVQWGVVSTGVDGVGHCAFSNRPIKAPGVGQTYAGTEN